ncbi:hypothetical protein [Yinghuangia sp. YIM S09857]|uniref:hypothetical protein n=1 Tax=Yinghuangia sp. YIM S09857 TaxID=3436929 RepID=UPI003F533D08
MTGDAWPFLVAWGLGATACGLIIATDFRGAARRLHTAAVVHPQFADLHGARWGVGFVRALGAIFAVAGPVALIAGLIAFTRDEPGPDSPGRFPTPVLVAWCLLIALGFLNFWKRTGWLHRVWTTGNPRHRAAALVLSAAILGFATTTATGHPIPMLACWLVGMLASLTLLLGKSAPAPEPAANPDF